MDYVLKFIHGEYEDENALYDVNKYIYQPYKTKGLIGGYNILPEYAVDMMQDVKDLYHDDNGKMLIHFIVSVPMKYSLLDTDMLMCARIIASAFDTNQVVYGIHSDKDHMHAHFMVNTITLNGEKIAISHIRAYISSICKEVLNSPIVLGEIFGQN